MINIFKRKRKHSGKWKNKDISINERKAIYQKTRVKAYVELKNKHKKEYRILLNRELKKEFKKI